jgi:hypothetical protein
MLTIRNEQMVALALERERRFRANLPRTLLRMMPDLATRVSPEALESFAERAVIQAMTYGFESPRDIFTYVSLAALLGEGTLEDDPWTLALLTNKELSGIVKSEVLLSAAERLAMR